MPPSSTARAIGWPGFPRFAPWATNIASASWTIVRNASVTGCAVDGSVLLLEFIYVNRHHTVVDGFEIIGAIADVEIIAVEGRIRDIERLRKAFGSGRWRKLKGKATVRLDDGYECRAEVHWYEAHGIGKKEMKIKEILD